MLHCLTTNASSFGNALANPSGVKEGLWRSNGATIRRSSESGGSDLRSWRHNVLISQLMHPAASLRPGVGDRNIRLGEKIAPEFVGYDTCRAGDWPRGRPRLRHRG